MKTSTVVIVGLGAAAVLFLVLRMRGSVGAGGTIPKNTPVPTARNTQQALERAAVNVGEKLANEAIDWAFSGDRSSVESGLAV